MKRFLAFFILIFCAFLLAAPAWAEPFSKTHMYTVEGVIVNINEFENFLVVKSSMDSNKRKYINFMPETSFAVFEPTRFFPASLNHFQIGEKIIAVGRKKSAAKNEYSARFITKRTGQMPMAILQQSYYYIPPAYNPPAYSPAPITYYPLPPPPPPTPLPIPPPPSPAQIANGTLAQENFHYLGAFRLPIVRDPLTKKYQFGPGGRSLAFRPDGDPAGSADGYSGSLYIVGRDNLTAQIGIPPPVLPGTKDRAGLEQLNIATFLQGFSDVSGGMRALLDLGNGANMGGLAYLEQQNGQDSAKLYWTATRYYNVVGDDLAGHGWSELDLSNPQPKGLWHIGPYRPEYKSANREFHSLKNTGYLFDIPRDFANQYLGGRYLAAGSFGWGQGWGTAGPSIYAFAPWKDYGGVPPSNQSKVDGLPLMYYPANSDFKLEGATKGDAWSAGAWLTADNKHAVLFVGTKGLGELYYGKPKPGECSLYKGYHAAPYEGHFMLYDPAEFLRVLRGEKNPWEVQPYLKFAPSELFPTRDKEYPPCMGRVSGAAFDRAHNLLYVLQPNIDVTHGAGLGAAPIVHVYRI